MIRSLREVELFFLGQFYRLVHADQGCTVLAIVQSEGKKYTLKWTKIVSCTDLNSLSPLTIFLVILRQRLNVCKGFCLMIEFVSTSCISKGSLLAFYRLVSLQICSEPDLYVLYFGSGFYRKVTIVEWWPSLVEVHFILIWKVPSFCLVK